MRVKRAAVIIASEYNFSSCSVIALTLMSVLLTSYVDRIVNVRKIKTNEDQPLSAKTRQHNGVIPSQPAANRPLSSYAPQKVL